MATSGRPRRPQPNISPPDYSPPPQPNCTGRHRHDRNPDHDIYSYASLQNIPETARHNSFDSKYKRTSSNSLYRVSYEDLPELSLPNYYPDSKYDTDNTDNFSAVDNISSISLDNLSKTKFPSFDNLDYKWESGEQHESISYDENIVLTANKTLYDSPENKPKTIRRPTPYHESHLYGTVNPNSLPSHSEHSEEEKDDEEEDQTSVEYVETDTNLDEINLNNEDIAKVIEVNIASEENSVYNSNVENNPLYESTAEVKEAEQEEGDKRSSSIGEAEERKSVDSPIKTLIEVAGGEESAIEKTDKSEQYKTVVSVDTRPREQVRIEEESKCKHVRKESKHHSHNYLREFLETQKGSRKPLQNFIAKKFSNLSRRNSKDISNLAENQFYSLPDITASKNLRKCEKIDRKLRRCERRSKEASIENRFIVNIGRHFDITANSTIPVDFEVKIAKVPKKGKKQSGNKFKSDEQLIAAVKSLKETLHGSQINLDENHNISKPEIVSVTTKPTEERNEMANSKEECSREFKEKLGTMRNYWDKMVGNSGKDEEEKEVSPCKIIDLRTKVEDVKKIFEQSDEKPEEKPPSKVQLTKQLFEPKPVTEKFEKISPLIRETCSYFENNANTFFDNDRQFESLCPSAMEIIDKDAKTEKAKTQNDAKSPSNKPAAKPRTKKSANKTKSVRDPPEFDHVRYKVVKSDLFQKKIFAKCEKESQFDGLMQYLQDYSFQELLIDNNIVIIEPIRSKVHYEPSNTKTIKNVTPLLHKQEEEENKPGLNRHFFYHPIRVNREVNDDELPNPDTVRQVRELFEGGLKVSKSIEDLENAEDKYASNTTDPDKDRCSATDSNSHPSNMSDFGSQENLYDSIDNEIYCEYVSEDILEKIREHGTTVTYYGGRIVDRQSGQPVLTKAIMEEIRNNEKKCRDCSNCRKNGVEQSEEAQTKEEYVGVKFRILKSNSCSSRLELVGTDDIQETRKKFIAQHKKISKRRMEKTKESIEEVNLERERDNEKDKNQSRKPGDKNAINESIKKQSREENQNQPKIIGEERKVAENKYVQWGELKKETTFANIQFNDKNSNKIYDYHNYDKIKRKTKRIDDMEFEPYEVA